MNCHNTKNKNHSKHKNGLNNHLLHMIICCGLPIAIIAMLPFIASLSPSVAGVLGKIAPFFCPLMMLSMIPMMMRESKDQNCSPKGNEKELADIKKPVE